MDLSLEQQYILRDDIAADPVLSQIPNTPDGAYEIAVAYNHPASPDFWVRRSALTEQEIVSQTSVDGTTWNWPQYITRSDPERDGWRRLFAVETLGMTNPALANFPQAIADIFSGTSPAPQAQRAHIMAMARRRATRAEALFANGVGTPASPALLTEEGVLSYSDVQAARNAT